jgi:ABC-type Fe2+-enterobactin transport system substrate-binding protein
MPSNTEPPYASSSPSIAAPPQRASAISINGTATQANVTVAATKNAPLHQLGGDVARAPRLVAASQQSLKPRRASVKAAAIAIAPITPRDPWLATSSNDACGTR